MHKQQILYYGPPGTGKTYEAREKALSIVNPNLDNELNSLIELHNTIPEEEIFDSSVINHIFEDFYEYDTSDNKSKSHFFTDEEYKPGKTCYRNLSALNKFMDVLIKKNINNVEKVEWPHKGPSTFVQHSRGAVDFGLAKFQKLERNRKGVELTTKGVEIKDQYEQYISENPTLELSKYRDLPNFAKEHIIEELKRTNNGNMSMWKNTIIGALWFIVRNGYIFKYRSPERVTRTTDENIILEVCLGYTAEANDFLGWVVPYLEDLDLVIKAEESHARYINKYYLSPHGKDLILNMDIIKSRLVSLEEINTEDSSNLQIEKIYTLNEEFRIRRNKIKNIFSQYRDCDDNKIEMVTFHPSFEYENFIEGISVKTIGDKLNYYNKDGVLKDICYRALKNLIERNLEQLVLSEEIPIEEKQVILDGINNWKTCYSKYIELKNELSWDYCDNFVLIIDEINRGDISKVFGEVITLLENDKRIGSNNEQIVKLPFTQDKFGIPKNIYVLATMNTSDRSISMMDIALRRRFSFTKCNPKLDLVNELYTFIPTESDNNNLLSKSVKALKNINKKMASTIFIGPDKLIGHSYLMVKDVLKDTDIVSIWSKDILPLIDEYFVGEYEDMIELLPTWIVDEDSKNIIDVTSDKIIELIEILANENE